MDRSAEEVLDELYKIFELSRNATSEELKKAYRKLAYKYHPDLNNDSEESIKKMSYINNAYDILTNQNKLREYLNNYTNKNKSLNQIALSAKNIKNDDINCPVDASYIELEEPYETFDDFIEYLIERFLEEYKQIKQQEKNHPLKIRYTELKEKLLKLNYYQRIHSKLIRKGLNLITFSGIELIYQLKKLKKQANDTIPKYIVRNRKTLAGILILSTLISPVSTKTNDKSKNEEPSKEKIELMLDDSYKLVRVYTVKKGQTLSEISQKTNTPLETIISYNKLKTLELEENQELEIPQYIPRDELKYYTTSVNTKNYENLEKLAEEYQTNLRTIYSINTEAFANIDGKYFQISDELLVPKF